MKHIRYGRAILAATLLFSFCLTGCKEQVESGNSAPSVVRSKPGPVESFELIVETFRRRVEDTPVGFVLQDSGGRSMLTGKNKVGSEVIPPAKEGDPYKAVITVDSESSYSINRSKPGSEKDSSRDQESDNNNRDPLVETDATGRILDSDLISESGGENAGGASQPQTTKDIVAQRPDMKRRQYELVYNNGLWTLVTKLDQKTEASIQYAFDQALKTQI